MIFIMQPTLSQSPPHGSTIIDVRTLTKKRKFELQFEVLNALIKPDTHPLFRMVVRPKQ